MATRLNILIVDEEDEFVRQIAEFKLSTYNKDTEISQLHAALGQATNGTAKV